MVNPQRKSYLSLSDFTIMRGGGAMSVIEWKTFVYNGKETHYRVSNNGDVENLLTGRRIKPYVDKKGYLKVEIGLGNGKKTGPNRKDGKRVYRKILSAHTMTALMFVHNPNPSILNTVNHINHDKLDNWYENLEWMSNSDNIKESYTSGMRDYTKVIGINKNKNYKYTVAQIHGICKLWAKGYRNKAICRILNLPMTLIKDVLCGKSWCHVSCQYDIEPKVKRRDNTAYSKMYMISETGKIKLKLK